MIKFVAVLALVLIVGFADRSMAANLSLTINITSPTSTAVSCTVNYPSGQTSFVTPVAAGAAIASCAVTPSTWSGALSLGGTDASYFSLSGSNITVGASAITAARTYNITVTASP